MGITLPGEDRTLSPYTGYTRAHWEAVADGLLGGAWRWATPRGALIDLPGPPSVSGARSDGLEGFARTFLAAAFRVAGAGGDDPHGWLSRYAEGLAAGTATPGRDDAESWPAIGHQYLGLGQPMVESASVAIGLRLTRPWLWDALPDGVRDRVAGWLRGALDHRPAPNNWHLFPFTVAGFLESAGRGDERTALVRDRARALLETWYRGDGWYSDGDGRAFDHYNGWALHLYPVLDDHLAGNVSAYGTRLHSHLDSFSLLFDGNGAPIHFGRSLTYRFAAASAVGLGAVTGHTPLPPGTSRRLVSGALRYFLERGGVGADGLLSLGWHGPHAATTQVYSGPASPYWASKAFVCLLAPADHPLWTAQETAPPADARVRSAPAPGFLIQATPDGIVRLHNHGSDSVAPTAAETTDNPHYGRQAYSTRTGPTAPGNLADNHFCVVLAGVRSIRKRIHPLGAGHGDDWGWAASWHRPVFPSGPPFVPGLRVESITVARGECEVRVHRVVGAPHDATVEQTGWATGPEEPLRSTLRPLAEWITSDEPRAPAGTAFTRWATMPRLAAPAADTVYVAMAALTSAGEPVAAPQVQVAAGVVELRWPDSLLVRVGFEPVSVTES
jgi:hypothetical protein